MATAPLTTPLTSSTRPPHLVHFLADDLGWASVGYHRAAGDEDVRTPNIDALAAAGVQLDRHYAHKICSPSRCAVQSGRAPVHVNVQNVLPEAVNPDDPIGGYQGMPLNMTGIASVLGRGGYRRHFVGKWDVGMATERHHPRARGYESWYGCAEPSLDLTTSGWPHTFCCCCCCC